MPSPYVKKVAIEIGKSIEEVDKHWNHAKKIAEENLGKLESKFNGDDYGYAVGILKHLLGINETIKIKDFIDSKMSAKEYVETVISSQFNIGKIIPPVKRKDLDNDEDELPGQKKEEKFPSVIQLSLSQLSRLPKEPMECAECGCRYMAVRGSPCPACTAKELAEKTDNPEDVELDTAPFHVDTPLAGNDGGSTYVGENELIDREFAFLENKKEEPKKEKLTADRINELIAERKQQEENMDLDPEGVAAFDRMIQEELKKNNL